MENSLHVSEPMVLSRKQYHLLLVVYEIWYCVQAIFGMSSIWRVGEVDGTVMIKYICQQLVQRHCPI